VVGGARPCDDFALSALPATLPMNPANPTRRLASAACLLALSLGGAAHAMPYDEKADARARIASALATSAVSRQPVLVVFGANWCGDCLALDAAMKEGGAAPLIAKNFQVVKVDVGRFDRNLGLAEAYGVPLKKGIPALAVLSPDGRVLHATRGGELANARKMGDHGLFDYFTRLTAGVR